MTNEEIGKKELADLKVMAANWIASEYKYYDGTDGWQFLADDIEQEFKEMIVKYVDRLLEVSYQMIKSGEEPYVTGIQVAGFFGWLGEKLEEFRKNLEPNMWLEISKRE